MADHFPSLEEFLKKRKVVPEAQPLQENIENLTNDQKNKSNEIFNKLYNYFKTNNPEGTLINQWVVGITENLEKRKDEHKSKIKSHWQSWKTDHTNIAREVERIATKEKGFSGNVGGDLSDNTVFVYMFLQK